MDPTNVPIELISYRGLLKSLSDIKTRTGDKTQKLDGSSGGISKDYRMILEPIKFLIISIIFTMISYVEKILFLMMECYDKYIYSPLQTVLSPIVRLIPRYIYFGDGRKLPIFTANLVTLSRTFLVIPIAWFLKFEYNYAAFICVCFHDFLDHLDGIVAKVQSKTYPNHDDPLLGGFLDAFCDKIVNILSIWSILQTANFNMVTNSSTFIFIIICYAVMAYESVIGIVRIQDFFLATFKRDFKIAENNGKETDSKTVTFAAMEGKLKEKLESIGIALLCLAVSKQYFHPVNSLVGFVGLICLGLSVRMAHKSLMLKLTARRKQVEKPSLKTSSSADNILNIINAEETRDHSCHPQFMNAEMKMVDYANDDNHLEKIFESDKMIFSYKKRRHLYLEDHHKDGQNGMIDLKSKFAQDNEDKRVDKVYTIGCFDLFHHGHVQLIQRMRQLGRKVIVGVHDSRSIYKLKNRVPVDSTEKRMLNVKTCADEVFCIAGTDPSVFISCVVNLQKNETALYVRGDDMQNFPSREIVETLMPIKFLPYTQGVSSTQIRKEKYSHVAADDLSYLDKIN